MDRTLAARAFSVKNGGTTMHKLALNRQNELQILKFLNSFLSSSRAFLPLAFLRFWFDFKGRRPLKEPENRDAKGNPLKDKDGA